MRGSCAPRSASVRSCARRGTSTVWVSAVCCWSPANTRNSSRTATCRIAWTRSSRSSPPSPSRSGRWRTSNTPKSSRHGAEGLVVYQETYDRAVYQTLHTAGPKKNFDWRLNCPERAYAGGFRRIGIGALFGLADWKSEALALCAHLEYLYKHCWKAQLTVAFPRMRPYAGNYEYQPDPALFLPDKAFVRLIAVFRILFPQVGIVVSTREPAPLRDAIATLGVTHMSAGARTEPGGYTGAGGDDLHLTVKGRRVELRGKIRLRETATEQFQISDTRSRRRSRRHAARANTSIRCGRIGTRPCWHVRRLMISHIRL